tara:strand:- start:239 stop:442 length:204 start_codon:yes stop_codon:yes gene_type:complete
MKIGDLVRIVSVFSAHGAFEYTQPKIAMVIDGPNEVGKIKLLLSDGATTWMHSTEVEYLPKNKRYLK